MIFYSQWSHSGRQDGSNINKKHSLNEKTSVPMEWVSYLVDDVFSLIIIEQVQVNFQFIFADNK